MTKELTLKDLDNAIGAVARAFKPVGDTIIRLVSKAVAHLSANALEAKAAKCRDRRKRGRYIRKAKRLRAQYQ